MKLGRIQGVGHQRALKLKVENFTRCLNYPLFTGCSETEKENLVDCERFSELEPKKQVVIIALEECCQFNDADVTASRRNNQHFRPRH